MNQLIAQIATNYRTNAITRKTILDNKYGIYECFSEDISNGGMFDKPRIHRFGIYEGYPNDIIESLREEFSQSRGWHRFGGGHMEIYHKPNIIKVGKLDVKEDKSYPLCNNPYNNCKLIKICLENTCSRFNGD